MSHTLLAPSTIGVVESSPEMSTIRRRRPVPRELVHLSSDDAVHCTGWSRLDPTTYLVTAEWPAGTSTEVPGCGTRHESLVTAQTVRQAGLLLAHAEFGAPLPHAVLLRTFAFSFDAGRPVVTGARAALDIMVSCTETERRGNRTTGLHLDMTVLRDGHVFGTAATGFSWIPPVVYRRLRGDHAEPVRVQPPLPAPVPPASVGRATAPEVVLAPTGEPLRWLLRGDFTNTTLYDHAVDHQPGLVLIEAAHQAARLATAPGTFLPASVSATFDRYVEFDRPCTVEARVSGGTRTTTVHVTGHQDGQQAFTTVLTGPSRGCLR
ncbi:adhesin [Streptomyces mashuensis]|uniref:Adhesin n=1 Tax=Streptomyces mashuensis TaxID=33904 RepID=A0A919EBX6_9ACTN|nr:ScbA/BarX family gamma-butyrolactone biosynthesis protein [Streptomyces mashuensis]GHF36029.1 adhesin [Streptomyces mashuensis]